MSDIISMKDYRKLKKAKRYGKKGIQLTARSFNLVRKHAIKSINEEVERYNYTVQNLENKKELYSKSPYMIKQGLNVKIQEKINKINEIITVLESEKKAVLEGSKPLRLIPSMIKSLRETCDVAMSEINAKVQKQEPQKELPAVVVTDYYRKNNEERVNNGIDIVPDDKDLNKKVSDLENFLNSSSKIPERVKPLPSASQIRHETPLEDRANSEITSYEEDIKLPTSIDDLIKAARDSHEKQIEAEKYLEETVDEKKNAEKKQNATLEKQKELMNRLTKYIEATDKKTAETIKKAKENERSTEEVQIATNAAKVQTNSIIDAMKMFEDNEEDYIRKAI